MLGSGIIGVVIEYIALVGAKMGLVGNEPAEAKIFVRTRRNSLMGGHYLIFFYRSGLNLFIDQ